MKIRMSRQFWIIFFVVILMLFIACETKKLNRTIEKIEVDNTQADLVAAAQRIEDCINYLSSKFEKAQPITGLSGFDRSSEFRYKTLKPTGFVIVLLKDGTEIRCKNPFSKVSLNQDVKVKETATGDWVITR